MTDWFINKYNVQKIYYQLGYDTPYRKAVIFTNKIFIYVICGFIICSICSLFLKNLIISMIGIAISILSVKMSLNSLINKAKLLDQSRKDALPTLITNWCVYISAGIQIQAILQQSIPHNMPNISLHSELSHLSNRIRNGQSTSLALQHFSNNCNMSEVSKLVYFIQLHLRTGEDLLHHLVRLNQDLWIDKKFLVRRKGEEASAKLLFPMLVLLITIMSTLLYPVYILMRGEL
jgi:tight adherence protein C